MESITSIFWFQVSAPPLAAERPVISKREPKKANIETVTSTCQVSYDDLGIIRKNLTFERLSVKDSDVGMRGKD